MPAFLRDGESTVEEVIRRGEESGLTQEEAARELCSLWDDGRVKLSEPKPLRGFSSYLFGVRGLGFLGILAFLALDGLLIYANSPNEMLTYLKYLLGTILAFYMPGYVVVESVYSNRRDLDELERLVLSVGLSLTVLPLLALALSYTPWGVNLGSVFSLISIFVISVGFVSAHRRFESLTGGTSP